MLQEHVLDSLLYSSSGHTGGPMKMTLCGNHDVPCMRLPHMTPESLNELDHCRTEKKKLMGKLKHAFIKKREVHVSA